MRSLAQVASSLLLLAVLAACATDFEPTPADLRAAWEERNIPPTDYKADVLAYMRAYLNDPTKVRSAEISAPTRKTVADDAGERFVSCVRYNAKKSDGGYAGLKTGVAIYVGGRLDRFLDTPKVVKDVCKDVAFEPFPDMERLTR